MMYVQYDKHEFCWNVLFKDRSLNKPLLVKRCASEREARAMIILQEIKNQKRQ